MSAILETGAARAGLAEASDPAGPLPFDFVEFVAQRLGIDREQAARHVCAYVRAAWDLVRCASPGPA